MSTVKTICPCQDNQRALVPSAFHFTPTESGMEFCAAQRVVWDWDHCRALHSGNVALGSFLPTPTGESHRGNRNVQEHHGPAGMGAAAESLLVTEDRVCSKPWEMAWG